MQCDARTIIPRLLHPSRKKPDFLKELLKASNLYINAQDSDGMIALMLVLKQPSHLNLMLHVPDTIIERNPNPSIVSKSGCTIWHCIFLTGREIKVYNVEIRV